MAGAVRAQPTIPRLDCVAHIAIKTVSDCEAEIRDLPLRWCLARNTRELFTGPETGKLAPAYTIRPICCSALPFFYEAGG